MLIRTQRAATGRAHAREEMALERMKSTRSQLLSSFASTHSVPTSACLKDGTMQKVQSLQQRLDLDRCPCAALLRHRDIGRYSEDRDGYNISIPASSQSWENLAREKFQIFQLCLS